MNVATPRRPSHLLPPAGELALIERYTPLVRRIATALARQKPPALERDDVMQDGMLGLLRAIRARRAEASEPQFAAYAGTAIRGAIIDGYRQAGQVSRTEYAGAKRLRAAVARGETVDHAARDAADRVMADAWQATTAVDDDSVSGAVADPAPGPEQRAADNQLLRRAVDALQRLPVRDRSIFIACEFEDEARIAVARRHGLSAGRVTQIVGAVRRAILRALA